METFTLKHAEIVPSKEAGIPNARETTGFDNESLKHLADSIAKDGLRYPLTVWEVEVDGKHMHAVIDGERRWRAIGLLIKEKRLPEELKEGIPVELVSGSKSQAMLIGLTCNMQRSDLNSYELITSVTRLQEETKLTQDALAEHIHKSKTWVSRSLKAYKRSVPELKAAWKADKVPLDIVYDIADLPVEQQVKAVEKFLAIREAGGKQKKSEARKEAKERADKNERPSLREIRSMLDVVATANEKHKFLRGMRTAFAYVLGQIGISEFGPEYDKYLADGKVMSKLNAKNWVEEEE